MDTRILLLCSSRFAFQVMMEQAYFRTLAAVAIPAQCDEWLDHARAALHGSELPVIILQKETYIEQLMAAFRDHRANLGLMASFSFRIPETVYTIPPLGFYNLHPGPLPGYRGPDPVFWQIRNREPKACVSLHRVDAGWDSGPVVMREEIPLLPADTYGLLSFRLSLVGARLVQQLVKLLGFGLPLPERAQDPRAALYQRRQSAADVSIRWEQMDAAMITALMNACNPWNKGATTRSGTRVIRLVEGGPAEGFHQERPGTILRQEGSALLIACAAGTTLSLHIAATDEGIMSAGRLTALGLQAGTAFEDL